MTWGPQGQDPGAYSNYLPLYHMPFIFETYDGSPGAVKTFAHECGHGLHSFLKRGEPFIDSCEASSDLCEIHSMAMEFFVWPWLDRVYPEADVDKYRYFHMKSAISFLPYGAAVDEFQTEVYDHPDLTPAQRLELWQGLERRYMPWRKYKHENFLSQGRAWQRQTHVYKWPFYYIDYVLAQTCALQYHFLDEENHAGRGTAISPSCGRAGSTPLTRPWPWPGWSPPSPPGTVGRVGQRTMEFLEKNG